MKRFLPFWRRVPAEAGGADSAREQPRGLLTGDSGQDAQSLEVLLQSIAEVNSSIDLDSVLENIVDQSLEVTDAERAILFLGSDAAELAIRIARSRNGADLGRELAYSTSLVRRCLDEGHIARSVIDSDREALELGQSVYNLKLRAVMSAPLVVRERTVGVIYVDSRAQRREFSSRDEALFGALSAQLAIALENARLYADSLRKVRLEKDVEIAQRIQQHLLPAVPRDHPVLDIALRFEAADEASGDSYDFIQLADGRLVAFIGDVTGHGVGAALLTHAAQAALRSYFELVEDLSEVARRLNNRMVEGVETGNFLSLLLVCVDPAARTVHYVNCGHPSLLIVRAGGVVEEWEKTGMVLGVVSDQDFPSRGPIELCGGDLLLMHTDGVDETMNAEREVFGSERLRATLSDHHGQSADAVLLAVDDALAAYAGGVHNDDDLTMVAIRVLET